MIVPFTMYVGVARMSLENAAPTPPRIDAWISGFAMSASYFFRSRS